MNNQKSGPLISAGSIGAILGGRELEPPKPRVLESKFSEIGGVIDFINASFTEIEQMLSPVTLSIPAAEQASGSVGALSGVHVLDEIQLINIRLESFALRLEHFKSTIAI